MSITGTIAIYFIIWWLVFFAVLPFGVRTQEEDEDVVAGSVGSAPSRPILLRKALITTVIAALVFGAFHYIVNVSGLTLDDIPFLPGKPDDWPT